MFHVDIPSRQEFLALSEVRADACVSIYLATSPLRDHSEASQIQLGNLIDQALQQLADINFDKRRLAALEEELLSVLEDETFWRLQANSLAILATPEHISTYRLANVLSNQVEVSERFHLKPLLRALTFPHSAYVLALSENEVRVIECFADAPAEVVSVADLPKDATSAVRMSSLRARKFDPVHEKVRLAQFTRKIDQALRPVFTGHDAPLILVSAEPLASIYRSTNTLPNLVQETVFMNAEHIGVSDLVTKVRPVLDNLYQAQLDALKPVFELRAGERRVTQDLSDAAKAATHGAIDLLLIDIEQSVPGTIDEQGNLTLAAQASPSSYGVIDEIAKRALATGARVLAVRQADLPTGAALSAVLRYSI